MNCPYCDSARTAVVPGLTTHYCRECGSYEIGTHQVDMHLTETECETGWVQTPQLTPEDRVKVRCIVSDVQRMACTYGSGGYDRLFSNIRVAELQLDEMSNQYPFPVPALFGALVEVGNVRANLRERQRMYEIRHGGYVYDP